ncbi:lipid-A-disaccharide synthase [Mongoliibacter ruber]|uniref:Lipid-A-disaccharide synthase n=1 Tax=Mongoliibacter ruber TaxID=1750599 RepID=A0A2T0WBE5_9BACT|nr:lipid-A-disaccharide synthase [Mongoliibacter ruber]PRY84023.1 lipid-A-disaccharide synthase [Mongoliibacter ruber]
MKYYLICGERSGDLHSSNLIKAIKVHDEEGIFRGMGGDYSAEAGLNLKAHYEEVSVMGFIEVLFGFRKVLKYLRLIKEDLLQFRPDVLILVDFGGFNMKMAAFAKSKGIKVHYYIPPKVWAWNQKRALNIKKQTDKVYSILPFEPEFFKKYGIDAQYVGNPLFDEIAKFEPHPFFHQKNELNYQPIIALLPGSRQQELDNMLSVLISVVKNFPNAQFVIAGVGNLKPEAYSAAIKAGIRIVFDQTYDLLHHATAAIVTSGTATLETALFRVPQVVVYKTSSLSYLIAKRLIKVPYISLVNLIANEEVVKELIQDDFNSSSVSSELNYLLADIQRKARVLNGYDLVKQKLGEGSASAKTAQLIHESFNGKELNN